MRRALGSLALALACAAASALPARAQAQAPAPSPTPAASATPAPTATPPLLPTFAPSLLATPLPVYNFVFRPASGAGATPFPVPGAPEIVEIDVTDQTLAAPGPLHARVLTNDSVVSVVAQAYGYELEIPRRGPGLFAIDAIIPIVPDAARGKQFNVDIVATTKDGRTATVTLSFLLK
jgi:hypothetical protein